MRTRYHRGILFFLAALFVFPATGRADNLFRFYPELQAAGFYSDNVPLRTTDKMGDFGSTMIGGFFLDYTSAARYASLHYDTFAQLFTHQTKYDRAGEGQAVGVTDDENLSRTTKLRLDEFFCRDAPGHIGIITGAEVPQFNSISALLLLATDQSSINWFNAALYHYWGRNWSSSLNLHQVTLWENGSNGTTNKTGYEQSVGTVTEYHLTDRFALGPGYRFYDFRFSNSGVPGEQAHWPLVRTTWQPTKDLTLQGSMGVLISHTQGSSGAEVNPAGLATLEYNFSRRTRLTISGGQEPQLDFAGAGLGRFARGRILHDFTPRLTGHAGVGYYEESGSRFDAQLISWGFGLSERVNRWLRVYAQFVELRRNETGSSQFLPSGNQSGNEAVGDYITVGLNVSIEAFRWSWQ